MDIGNYAFNIVSLTKKFHKEFIETIEKMPIEKKEKYLNMINSKEDFKKVFLQFVEECKLKKNIITQGEYRCIVGLITMSNDKE